MRRLRSIVYRLVVGGLLLNLLWLLASIFIDSHALISPLRVYAGLPKLLSGEMLSHLYASLYRLLLGIPLALLLGTVVAFLMFGHRLTHRWVSAFTYLAYPIPKLALLPIVMLIAGLGDAGKVTMIVLILLFQVIVNMRDSLSKIPRESFYIATSLGATRPQLLKHVLLPATLPDLLSTLRVAIGTAISVLFVTETYGTDRGMGFFIVDAWMRLDYLSMYGGIVVLSIAGFILFVLTDLLEVSLSPWRNLDDTLD